MRLKKFLVSLMAMLMCFSVGHFTYAEEQINLFICLPDETEDGVESTSVSLQLQSGSDPWPFVTLEDGERVICEVNVEPDYKVEWYICDYSTSTPGEDGEYLSYGEQITYTVSVEDNNRYLYAVVSYDDPVPDETYTVHINTEGHGDDIIINNVEAGTSIFPFLRQIVSEGRIQYRDGNEVFKSFDFYDEYGLPWYESEYEIYEDLSIRVVYAQEIERVDLTVSAPVKGTVPKATQAENGWICENYPQVTIDESDKYHLIDWRKGAYWIDKDSITLSAITLTRGYGDEEHWPMAYSGVIDNRDFLANIDLVAAEKYAFTDNTEVYVNGEKTDIISFHQNVPGMGPGDYLYVHNGIYKSSSTLSVFAPVESTGELVLPTGISVEKTYYYLAVGSRLTIEPILEPEGAAPIVQYTVITGSNSVYIDENNRLIGSEPGEAIVRLEAGGAYVDVNIHVENGTRVSYAIYVLGPDNGINASSVKSNSSFYCGAGSGLVNVDGGSYCNFYGYEVPGNELTLSVEPLGNYVFKGWYKETGEWYSNGPSEYNLKTKDYTYNFTHDSSGATYIAFFVYVPADEMHTLTIDTCGHGEDIVIPDIPLEPYITETIYDAIADGLITYRDGDKIIQGFYLDADYTLSPEMAGDELGKVNRDVTVYVKWADEIKKVDITVSRPVVGQESILDNERYPGSYSNAPVVTDNIGGQYNLSNVAGGAFWGKNCDLSAIKLTEMTLGGDGWPENFEGVMDNSGTTYVNVNFHSAPGYMFTESTEVYINGVKTDVKSFLPNYAGFGMGFGFGSFWMYNENFTCEQSLSVFAPIEPYIEPKPADATVKLVHTEFDLSTWTWFGNLQSTTTDYNGNDITVTGTGPVVQGEKASFTISSNGTKAFRAEVSARNADGEFVYINEFDSLWQDLQFEKTASSKTVEYPVPAESDIIITINVMDKLIIRTVNNRPEMYNVQEFTTVNAGEPIEIIFNCQDGYELSSEQQFMGSEGHGNPAWNGSFFNPKNYTKVNPEVVDISVKNRMSWIAGAGEHEIYPNIVFVGYQSNDEKKLEDAVAVEENNNYQNPGIVIYNETEEPKVYTVDLSTGTQQSSQNNMRRLASALAGGATLMSGVVPTSGENGIGDVYLYVTTGKVDDPSSAKQEVIEVNNLSSLTVTIDPGDYVTYSIVKKEDGSQLNKYSYEVTDVTAEEPVVVDKGYVYSDDTVKHLIVSDKIGITSVKLDKSAAEMNIGEGISLSAVVNPEETTEEKTITWSSSDPSVAYVSNDGKVTALKEGEAVITATAVNGVSGECKVTVNGIEMPEDAKFQVTVSSVSQQLHSVGSVTGTVYNDYHGELTVDGVQVNDGNVTVDLWMQNVGSLGVDSLRHYSTTVSRENGREHALKTLTDNIFDPLVGKTITGINGDSKAVYTITKADGDQYKLIASVNEDDARKLWHQLINENTVRSYTGEDDSKITIAHGSWFNLGDEKLVFEDNYKEDLVLDDFSKLAKMKQNMKDALRIAEGDGSVTVYLEKGSILSVGQSKLELLDELKVTFSLDGSIYEQVFTEASQAADNELLGKVFAIALNAITSLEDNTDVTFEFGHKYADEITYEWAEDYSEVTATLVCENNPDHNVVETVKTTSEVTKPATCTAKGETTYTAVFENESFETQTKTVENIEAAGHKPADPVKENNVEPTCTEDGGYDSVVYCSVCHEKLSSEHVVVPKKGHTPGEVKQENVKEATCTEPGSYDEVVRCTVCGEIISSEHKTTEALGHIWSDWVVTKEPTCKEKGQETRECLRCGDIEVRELDKIDHIWDEGKIIVEPTFSNTGLIEYTCTVCGEKKQEELPKGKVINMVVGEESSFTIGVNANNYMYFEPENPDVANAAVISTGQRETATGIQYTRKIRVLGDSVGFAKIAMKVNNSTLAYIYAVVSAGNDNVVRCVGDEKVISLTTFDSHTFTISNPDIKLTVAKEQKITKVIIGSETYEAPAYYNTLTLSFDKPVTDKNVTITTEDGEIYYLNVIVSEHDYGKWVYDGPSAKTHTHVCSKDPSHTETQPCEFDEGVVAGNLITYTCKVCGGTYTKDIDNPDDNGVIRIAGDNRFGTSQKIASAYKRLIGQEKVDAVILANGDVFADALAGSYLAAEKQAPIIITRAGKEAEINAYIRSILKEGGSIYILGGTAAVPEACLNGLVGRGYSISRLWGNNRYLTNLAILDSLGVQGDKVLVATGNNFADSLSASATGMPILLVRDDGLTEEQREFLSRNSGKEFIILGGTNAINTQIEAQLTSYGTVRRIAGDNRAKTSIEIAKEFFPDAKIAVTAYSHDFPDGLCGGPLANRLKAPLLLTRDRNADDTAAYMKSRNIKDGYVLGGPVRLTDSLIRKVFGLDASDKIIEFK